MIIMPDYKKSDLDYGVEVSEKITFLDDNFFGDSLSDQEENVVIVLDKETSINPFFVSMKNNVTKMKDRDLFKTFKRVLILCHYDETPKSIVREINRMMNSRIITGSDMKEYFKYLTFVQVEPRVIKNFVHKTHLTILERNAISVICGMEYENTELVLPYYFVNKTNAEKYAGFNSTTNDIYESIKMIMFKKYFNCYSKIFDEKLFHLFNSIDDSNYWTIDNNCNVSMTKEFMDRRFNFKESLYQTIKASVKSSSNRDEKVNEIIDKIAQRKENYDLNNIYRKAIYTDISQVLLSNGKYFVNNNGHVLTKSLVNDIFNSLHSERELYEMFNIFSLSKDLCHFVINNKFVLEKMAPLFNKYLPVYRYTFGYAWLCFYFESMIKKTNTKITDRYIFDIDTASKLPCFPFCSSDPKVNPYFTVLIDDKILNYEHNCNSIGQLADTKYSIDDLKGFRSKFNIFTSGKLDKSIFDGLEREEGTHKWKSFAVSGSVIASCVEKRNPLIDVVTSPTVSYCDKYKRYFMEYYKDSDIDVICNKSSVFEFMNETMKLIDVVENNLSSSDTKVSLTIEPVKTLMVVVSLRYVEECMKEYESKYIIENLNSDEIKELFYEKYVSFKTESNKKHRKETSSVKNKLYEHFFKVVPMSEMNIIITTYEVDKDLHNHFDSDNYVYLNDVAEKKQDHDILILKIAENIKFKLSSPKMERPLEVFRSKYSDYFSVVARFHLPIVRGFYNGENVYVTPELITAIMTHTNIDYKYFAGIRDPIDIIDKYRVRGFGTILNDTEQSHMLEYNKSVEKWKKIFELDKNKSSSTMKSHMGAKCLDSNMFRPGKYEQEYPDSIYKTVKNSYIDTLNDLSAQYSKQGHNLENSCVDLLKLRTIGKDGNIIPLKRWALHAGYDVLNK